MDRGREEERGSMKGWKEQEERQGIEKLRDRRRGSWRRLSQKQGREGNFVWMARSKERMELNGRTEGVRE